MLSSKRRIDAIKNLLLRGEKMPAYGLAMELAQDLIHEDESLKTQINIVVDPDKYAAALTVCAVSILDFCCEEAEAEYVA